MASRAFREVTNASGRLRDRPLIAVVVFAFARVFAVVGLRVEDYFPLKKRWWLRLHEKSGKATKWDAITSLRIIWTLT
jgi:hypothetical protein